MDNSQVLTDSADAFTSKGNVIIAGLDTHGKGGVAISLTLADAQAIAAFINSL